MNKLTGRPLTPPAIRFEKFLCYTGDCIVWTGFLDKDGYGIFRADPHIENKRMAHRFSYEQLSGPIPRGMVINHLCRNRSCVNAGRLEVVTNAENILHVSSLNIAKLNKDKTHCKRGHAFTPDNLLPSIKTGRACKICRRNFEKNCRRKIKQ